MKLAAAAVDVHAPLPTALDCCKRYVNVVGDSGGDDCEPLPNTNDAALDGVGDREGGA